MVATAGNGYKQRKHENIKTLTKNRTYEYFIKLAERLS